MKALIVFDTLCGLVRGAFDIIVPHAGEFTAQQACQHQFSHYMPQTWIDSGDLFVQTDRNSLDFNCYHVNPALPVVSRNLRRVRIYTTRNRRLFRDLSMQCHPGTTTTRFDDDHGACVDEFAPPRVDQSRVDGTRSQDVVSVRDSETPFDVVSSDEDEMHCLDIVAGIGTLQLSSSS